MSTLSTTILVAEDDNALRHLVCEFLKKISTEVIGVADGAEALKVISTGRVDVILSDIQMPAMDGLTLLREVRKRGLETPFVLLSGHADKENVFRALQLGAVGFLEKPFQKKSLLEVMTNALELGVCIKKSESEIDHAFKQSGISNENAERFKRAKLAIALMRESSRNFTDPLKNGS